VGSASGLRRAAMPNTPAAVHGPLDSVLFPGKPRIPDLMAPPFQPGAQWRYAASSRRPDERRRLQYRLRTAPSSTAAARFVIAALVFTLSPVHDDAHYVAAAAKLAACKDIDALYIKIREGCCRRSGRRR